MNLGRRAALLQVSPTTSPARPSTVLRVEPPDIRMASTAIRPGRATRSSQGSRSISQVDGLPEDMDELHPSSSGTTRRSPTSTSHGDDGENVAEQSTYRATTWERFATAIAERAVAAQGSGFFDARSPLHEG